MAFAFIPFHSGTALIPENVKLAALRYKSAQEHRYPY